MTQIDQFESVFKAASKTLYHYQAVALNKVLIVSDLEAEAAESFTDRLRTFLSGIAGYETLIWETATASSFSSVGDLLELVEGAEPDLICTYRNLQTNAWRWPYTLGDHLEVLTQASHLPILVVPRPDSEAYAQTLKGTTNVMALTDHLTGDDRLVNHAVRFAADGGQVLLTHVEDEAIFQRYVDVISKLPEVETDSASAAIREQLLKEPADYIRSCKQVLAEQGLSLQLKQSVTLGHRLGELRQLVDQHRVDLLVLNTKDDDQLAMHGLAYPLAIELRHLPLLML